MARKDKSPDKLSNAEIRKLNDALLAKRNEILGSVTEMESEALRRDRTDLSNMPLHMADVGSDNYEIENMLGLMDSEKRILMEINGALDRIESGTYGICESGGERIPKKRLEAIPWARYCINCAALSERGLLPAGQDDWL
ncbi:MAG: TraR/DksA family transcriptional regulator [Planctomycetota bacterium]|jgi:RNA polymerase-binding protein DksA